MNPVVLDAGALIALERRDARMVALGSEIVGARCQAHTPAGVVAQIWRGSSRQHAIARLVRSGIVRVDPLTDGVAFQIGLLLAASGTSDVVDGHVALLARRIRGTVVTSDPEDIVALDPKLTVFTV